MKNDLFDITSHNGKLTIRNPKTNGYRTFSIRTQKDDARFAPGKRIVALLNGPDNTKNYQSFGFVRKNGTISLFLSKSTGVWKKHDDMIVSPLFYPSAEYLFEGHCRVCNRLLTPDSIKAGIGPTCQKKT